MEEASQRILFRYVNFMKKKKMIPFLRTISLDLRPMTEKTFSCGVFQHAGIYGIDLGKVGYWYRTKLRLFIRDKIYYILQETRDFDSSLI